MTYKCIRCGKEAINTPQVVGVWNIPYGRDGHLFTNEHKIVALCPDCQLPKVGEPKVMNDALTTLKRISCGEINNVERKEIWPQLILLDSCLKTQEKRIFKLERENDRLWEIIKCIGKEEK